MQQFWNVWLKCVLGFPLQGFKAVPESSPQSAGCSIPGVRVEKIIKELQVSLSQELRVGRETVVGVLNK